MNSDPTAVPQRNAEAPPIEIRPPAPEAIAVPAPVSSENPAAPPPQDPPSDPVADYRARTRYAPGSGALGAQAVDLLEPNRRYESFRPIEDTVNRGRGGEMSYLFTADKYYYEGDEVVRATLAVRRGEELVPVKFTRAQAVGESAKGASDEREEVNFIPEAGEYRAELDLDESYPEHHGPILLSIEFEYERGKTQEASLRIFSTPANSIPAHFTGGYSDTAVDGSLVVYADVQVREPGFYRFDLNLFSSDGAPLAFANFKGPLDVGLHHVPFEFFGLLLLDLGVSGPYQVRNLRGYLFLDGEYPDRLRLRDAENVYWTHAYEVASFSDEEFMSDHKARMIELIEQDVEAGISVDLPAAATGPESAF